MTDIMLPPSLQITSAKPRYIDNTAVTVGTYSGVTRTAALGGDKLGMSITFTTTGGQGADGLEKQGQLRAFLALLRGKQNRFYFPDPSYVQRGSFPAPELLANNTFSNGTTNWAPTSGNALTVSSRILRSTLTSTAANQQVRADGVAITSGAAYAARAMGQKGGGSMNWGVNLGTAAGANNLAASSTYTTNALVTVGGLFGFSNAYFSISDVIGARSVGDYQEFPYASLARCILVNNGGQTGSGLTVYGLPASTNDLLVAGDQIEVITSLGSELKIVTTALNSSGSGGGHIRFEPPLRGSVSANALVIVNKPHGRWVLTGQPPEWMNEPGKFTSATLEFEEAVA